MFLCKLSFDVVTSEHSYYIPLGEVVMADEHEVHRLKNLLSTQALTVWHDHSDICGEYLD